MYIFALVAIALTSCDKNEVIIQNETQEASKETAKLLVSLGVTNIAIDSDAIVSRIRRQNTRIQKITELNDTISTEKPCEAYKMDYDDGSKAYMSINSLGNSDITIVRVDTNENIIDTKTVVNTFYNEETKSFTFEIQDEYGNLTTVNIVNGIFQDSRDSISPSRVDVLYKKKIFTSFDDCFTKTYGSITNKVGNRILAYPK